MNTTSTFLNASIGAYILLLVFTAFVILLDKMWKRLPSDHPAVFSSPVNLGPIEDSVFASPKLFQEKLEYQLPKEKIDEY